LDRLALADFFLVTLGLGAVDEIVECLVRSFLAGEDEIIAGLRQHSNDWLTGEQIIAEIDRVQREEPFAVPGMPTFDGGAFAILLFRPVLRRDELGKQRHDFGVTRGDRRRRQHGVIALNLTVGALAPEAMRAAELLRAEIFSTVPGDQGS